MTQADRGTADTLGEGGGFPEGYQMQGDLLIAPSGTRFLKQKGGLDVQSRNCTVHVPYQEWRTVEEKFIANELSTSMTTPINP